MSILQNLESKNDFLCMENHANLKKEGGEKQCKNSKCYLHNGKQRGKISPRQLMELLLKRKLSVQTVGNVTRPLIAQFAGNTRISSQLDYSRPKT